MIGFPNVSLVKESSRPAIYLVVGDTKFWIIDPAEFGALGLRWDRVRVVDDGALGHLVEKRLHPPPRTRASDVHFDCGVDFDSITGRWHFNCLPSSSIVRRDVLVAGWLYRPPGDETPTMPYVNAAAHGIEDVHYNLSLDVVFLDRLYGASGLSDALSGAVYPGNPPSPSPLPFADTAPSSPGGPRIVRFNSWILPGNTFDIHGEFNAWHQNESGALFSRHFVGRGTPPAFWTNPLSQDPNSWFPFHPLDPEQLGRRLAEGDYVVMRGTLWEDTWHDAPGVSPWDRGPTAGHAWLEMHPVDWVVRVRPPSTIARISTNRMALCTPDATGPSMTGAISVTPDFRPSRPASTLQVRTVEQLVDERMSVRATLTDLSMNQLVDRVDVTATVQPGGGSQGRFKGSWLVGWREIDKYDRAWVDDALPAAAQIYSDGESWDWQAANPAPFLGARAHHSALVQGMHQHYFYDFTSPMTAGPDDFLFAHVHLDPDHPPEEVMLQWHSGDWRRAFWGLDRIGWGTSGTVERMPMGPLPFTGEWVRLEVPAARLGLGGRSLTGIAFTLYGGRAAWDYAGVRSPIPSSGRIRASATPNRFGVGRHGLTVSAVDTGNNVRVAGQVSIEGETHPTNTHFDHVFGEAGVVDVIVDCPGYPRATTRITVIEPGDDQLASGGADPSSPSAP